MTFDNVYRRLRGVLGNAIVWGAGWFIVALIVTTAVGLIGGASLARWPDAVRGALMFGVMGGIASTAFSLFIALRYRGKRLSDISWIRFGIGGGIVAGLFVPTFIIVMRFLSGDPFLAVQALLRNGIVGLAFGGAAAAITMKVAQSAERSLPTGRSDPGEIDAPHRLAPKE